jgi:hypothetical protein
MMMFSSGEQHKYCENMNKYQTLVRRLVYKQEKRKLKKVKKKKKKKSKAILVTGRKGP